MPIIRLETITPVHIGTGNTLREGIDYITQGNKLYILDLQKTAQRLGGGQDIQSIKKGSEELALAMGNGTLCSLLQGCDQNSVAKRVLPIHKGIDTARECREQIRDGRGLPYIPGSSLKGAIRTALLANLTADFSENMDVNAIKRVEKDLFGTKPEEDIFRFLQVGDAYFEENDSQVFHSVILNERGSRPYIIERNGQFDNKQVMVEAIAQARKTSFNLQLAKNAYKGSHLYFSNDTLRKLFADENYSLLFDIINTHTKKLLQSEIDWWEEREDDENGNIENYLAGIDKLLRICLSSNSCLLRVGYGSGYRFITGDWTRRFNYFTNISASAKWRDKYADDFEFPKSRRVADYSDSENGLVLDTLGFVKLTLK